MIGAGVRPPNQRVRARAPHAVFVTALSPAVVTADATLLDRARSNLRDNALKYGAEGAPIEVSDMP